MYPLYAGNVISGDFGMDDREMMREENAFEVDIIHGSSASTLLLEAEPGPAHLPDKSTNLDYDDFGDNNLETLMVEFWVSSNLIWPVYCSYDDVILNLVSAQF